MSLLKTKRIPASDLPNCEGSVNYLGKRGGFVQFLDHYGSDDLDAAFTQPVKEGSGASTIAGQRLMLDDFGPGASFDALNSFSPSQIRRGVHRIFVETAVPLEVYNGGPGFVHYCAPGAIL